MRWSIYKDTNRNFGEWQENHVAWFYDEDAPSASAHNRVRFFHDGHFTVHFGERDTFLTVVDGKWAPNTKERIEKLVRDVGYWGDFIEGFTMRGGRIEVNIGS